MTDLSTITGFKYLRLDDGTRTEKRAGHFALFNAKDFEIDVFSLFTRAGGLHLNLQTADTVIIFMCVESISAGGLALMVCFIPSAFMIQAQDRAHRIGITNALRTLRFITEQSAEEMSSRARPKPGLNDQGSVIFGQVSPSCS